MEECRRREKKRRKGAGGIEKRGKGTIETQKQRKENERRSEGNDRQIRSEAVKSNVTM